MKLDLGAGYDPVPGFIAVDTCYAEEDEDHLIVDLMSFPWPWGDDSVDEVVCQHFIEHLPPGMWVTFVDELYRVMKPGAMARITWPNVQSVAAFQDPTHRDYIPMERWSYASKHWRVGEDLDRPPYPTCDFEIVQAVYSQLDAEINEMPHDDRQYAVRFGFNAARQCEVVLKTVKDV